MSTTHHPPLFVVSAFVAVMAIVVAPARAQERIAVYPSSVTLTSRRDVRQLVVTGYFGGVAHDVTAQAQLASASPKVVSVSGGRIAASGDGRTSVRVTVGKTSIVVPVVVAGAGKPDPVRFVFETVPVLTKQGCASGSCHGSPHGKGGFSLSLFGYEPTIDRVALTRDGFSRRVNVLEPDESLILKKPTLQIPHVGGKRFRPADTGYKVLRQWVAEGANVALPNAQCTAITVTPASGRVLTAPFLSQQLSVLAHFSDGSVRDVTRIATYDSSSASVASADTDGRITGKSRGQTAISVRYLDKLESVPITVVVPIKGFVWKPTPKRSPIDRLVNDKLRQLQYLPSGKCTDSEFVRRVYLDLTGLLPTADTARTFLADKSPDKRDRLIDALVDSEEFARFWALKQADLMRVSPRRLPGGQAERFARWLIDQTRTNAPYDTVARTILTATGPSETAPTAAYYLAIPTPEERTEMTAQVFLGARVECAKCHNHPFENWTMRDYYKIAAVFARTQAKDGAVSLTDSGEVKLPTSGETMAPWAALSSPNDDRRAAFASWLTRPQNPFFARVAVNRIWASLLGRGIVDPVDDFRSSNPPSNAPLLEYLASEFARSGFDRKKMVRLICKSETYQRETRANVSNAGDESLFSHAKPRLLSAEQLSDAIGLTAGALAPASILPEKLAAVRARIDERNRQLDASFPAWLADTSARVAKLPYWSGAWRSYGPFEGDQKTLESPKSRPDGGVLLAELVDGAEYRFDESPGRVRYVYRRIQSDSDRTVMVQLKVADAGTLWLNGERVGNGRGPLRGDQRVTLVLRKGENHLTLKLLGGAPSIMWTLDGADNSLPAAVVEALATGEGKDQISSFYRDADSALSELKRAAAQLSDRTEYATQRLFPELSAFTKTFGQPARETACTCERRDSPTLLQALELLNGKASYTRVAAGAPGWERLDNHALTERLYLAAVSRYPTPKEQRVVDSFLSAHASDRRGAITDLIWTVVNTQEFLFQR